MQTYDVIIFDLDGTLTDPKTGITKSIQYALSRLRLKEDNLEKLKQFIGPPLLESFMKHYSLDDSQARRAVNYYREYFSDKGMFENRVYPGISGLLNYLHRKNKKLILATSKPTVYSKQILKYFNLDQYFSLVLGSNLDLTRTSKKDIIHDILFELTDYQKSQMVMVGDRDEDIIGAQSNGIDSIAVTYGYGSIEELEKVSPRYIVHSVDELKSLITAALRQNWCT